MEAQLKHIDKIDRSAVRRLAVERFDVSRMVDEYIRIFEQVA